MAQYFLKMQRYNSKSNWFVGPFNTESEGKKEIERAKGSPENEVEIVLGRDMPKKPAKAIVNLEVLSKVKARAEGLRSPTMNDKLNTLLGPRIPNHINAFLDQDEVVEEKPRRGRKTAEKPEPKPAEAKAKVEDGKDKVNTKPLETNWEKEKPMQTEMPMAVVPNRNVLIVTDKPGVIQWLINHGITGKIETKPTPEQIKGAIVYGILPNRLEALADKVIQIDLPHVPKELRGADLTPDQMDKAGARLRAYRTLEVEP